MRQKRRILAFHLHQTSVKSCLFEYQNPFMRSRLLALIILAAGFTACSREEIPVQNDGITGNWQLTAILSGQAKTTTGWVPISEGYAETLSLLPNGQYIKTVRQHNNTVVQAGLYTISEGRMLVLSPENHQPVTTCIITEKTSGVLILEKPVNNGLVKMSFVAVK
jgi:hypothetical protein